MLQGFQMKLTTELMAATDQAGKHLLAKTREKFDQQGPGWAPLSPRYKSWKASQGLDSRILFRLKLLYSMLQFKRRGISSGQIGLPSWSYQGIRRYVKRSQRSKFQRFPKRSGSLHRESMSVERVAKMHEEGAGVPKRPFFAPTAAQEAPVVARIYRDAVRRALR